MYDIRQLEARWDRYNKRRRRPLYVKSFALVALVVLAGLAYRNQKKIFFFMHGGEKSPTTHLVNNSFIDTPIETLIRKEKPIENFVAPEEASDPNNPMESGDIFVDEVAPKPHRSKKHRVTQNKPKKKKIHLEITEMSGRKAYVDVKNRFALAPDPDDSLFLARNYYKEKEYRKAAYWALQTNKLNGGIEESWLIFAKAKARLGQKNEAIRVLSAYASKSGSGVAHALLRKLKNK